MGRLISPTSSRKSVPPLAASKSPGRSTVAPVKEPRAWPTTSRGLVKKSKLTAFDSPRSGGIIAINLREDDEVIAARLVSPDHDLLLVSKGAQAIRFHASDESLRPMGRDTSGVIGMRFNDGDELLGMYVVRDGGDVLVATGGGYAKRTPVDAYPVQGRGGRGVVTAKIVEARGELVGALMVNPAMRFSP